ncbi:MAG: putative lipase [Loktanella salsilacus]|jgi:hypothetical protein
MILLKIHQQDTKKLKIVCSLTKETNLKVPQQNRCFCHSLHNTGAGLATLEEDLG